MGGIMDHLAAFQEIADANGGNRAGRHGRPRRVRRLRRRAARRRRLRHVAPGVHATSAPTSRGIALAADRPVPGRLRARRRLLPDGLLRRGRRHRRRSPLVDVNLAGDRASTSGCEAADFAGFPAGNIALIQRGSLQLLGEGRQRHRRRRRGGHHLQPGQRRPRRRPPRPLRRHARPAGAHDPGRQRAVRPRRRVGDHAWPDHAAQPGGRASSQVTTENLLADTPTGRTDRTVVVGGHLDSVRRGPRHQRQRLGHGRDPRDGAADGRARHRAGEPRAVRVLERRGGRPDRLELLRLPAHARRRSRARR